MAAFLGWMAGVAAADGAAPLPPPPELLEYIPNDFDDGDSRAAADPEATRQALEPIGVVEASPPPAPVRVSAPIQTPTPVFIPPSMQPAAPAPAIASVAAAPQPIRISRPSLSMPDDYFNLPLEDAEIPGVLIPEIDYDFTEPGRHGFGVAARQAEPGMSIRQLEPYFALAKGSEGTALEARSAGNDRLFADQLSKSIDAYMAIIDMADAGTEAREEAWYGVARCEYRLGNWWRAFDALERSFPKRFERSEVAGRIKLEMFIGERLWRMGAAPVPEATEDGEPLNGYQAASRVYAAAIFNQPTSRDAPLALLRRGDAAAMDGKWEDAAKFYRQVVEYYPESEPAMQARSSLTEAIYRQDWPAGFPEAARTDVGSIMDDVERAAPQLSDEARERREKAVRVANDLEAETKLRHAKEYLAKVRVRKSRDAAVFLLGDIVSHYPGTSHADEAAALLRDMGIEPPMVLSDGSRFPITAGWSGSGDGLNEWEGGFPGGSARLEGQDDIGPGMLPPSPTRETIYAAPQLTE